MTSCSLSSVPSPPFHQFNQPKRSFICIIGHWSFQIPVETKQVYGNCSCFTPFTNIISNLSSTPVSPWRTNSCLGYHSNRYSYGSTRFCVDFRKLNSVTKKDCWPLPRICDIVDTMGQSKIFSTMDLKSAYHQIPVHPDDIEKTAFICHRGLYEFIRMPFGLANAPACLQRIMDYIFGDLIGRSVMIYLDDIVVFTKTEEEHAIVLQEVFSRLRKYGLRLKASKCNFGRHQVKLLGFILSEKGQAADPEKTKAISSLPPPRTVKQVRSFLGMTGYYRHCISYRKGKHNIRADMLSVWKDPSRLLFKVSLPLYTSTSGFLTYSLATIY